MNDESGTPQVPLLRVREALRAEGRPAHPPGAVRDVHRVVERLVRLVERPAELRVAAQRGDVGRRLG